MGRAGRCLQDSKKERESMLFFKFSLRVVFSMSFKFDYAIFNSFRVTGIQIWAFFFTYIFPKTKLLKITNIMSIFFRFKTLVKYLILNATRQPKYAKKKKEI